MLKNFYLADLKFHLQFKRPVDISPFSAGPMLRGAFGTALRRIVCHDPEAKCAQCAVSDKCAYQKIFAPVVSADAERLSKNRDLPRGFVIKPPLDGSRYDASNPFCFRMILVGDLVHWIPYIIVPFRELGDVGIGRARTPFTLDKIRSLGNSRGQGQTLYSASDQMVRPQAMVHLHFSDFLRKAQKLDQDRLTVRFLTPTILRYSPDGTKGSSRPMRVPEFHVFVKRLRDRVNRLSTAYCAEAMDIDYRAFGERAERVVTESVRGRWVDRKRRTRAGKTQDLGGFVGEITFSGPIGEFLPLILVGEYLHVGKNAVFGNGWYEVLALAVR
ncbi:MAG: CRISPR system precrRNA processing endoribonuclease RAMP protein Cas6 [Deltaproteobacteria bacterium]|nr:CRISPR system precrRNA processing endoribonuclease RAMP protein Cas6 [Deltaproteobacteria bacterium]MBW2020540.1 CRISPR system precrRNA processing endoribonuclease RAMP protein Cas6 [Deltaproteobacteria bacterium]MBW2073955.1 CRISPR system precrRNA processing endoribonuclease RAMP protein Cas6 [Deltaproteobacteria bacterium]RLB82202.1 MAG: hypothetical protein DRH17_06645 [Deltaproteobacteria bacterium]